MSARSSADAPTWGGGPGDATKKGLTALLNSYTEIGDDAQDEIFRRVYFELRRQAELGCSPASPERSLRATGLVHDVYLGLFQDENVQWKNRRHFFAVAARAMRSVLVDHARAQLRKPHEDRARRSALDDLLDDCCSRLGDRDVDLLNFDAALKAFEVADPRAFEVLQSRFFLGLPMSEIATVLGVSERMAERDLTFARSWIANRLLREREVE
jgi:RNA polymerase sigma factor (TIGR02999 family)